MRDESICKSGNCNLYQEVNYTNLIPRMIDGGAIGTGRMVDPKTLKVEKTTAIETDSPWIYVNPNPQLYCMDYQAMFKGFGFIPTPCLECWKIVVQPRNFHELMCLYDLQRDMVQKDKRCWCKCGIERRDFVPRNYGGYFYTRSKVAGLRRLKEVRDLVGSEISEDIPVILKRYCTEFELRFGPSDKYIQPEGAKEIEEYYWKNVNRLKTALVQPEFVRTNVIAGWLLFANGRGDQTAYLYNNSKPLFTPSITYEEE